jgi:uncharacterized RDD family membrane protein YckC
VPRQQSVVTFVILAIQWKHSSTQETWMAKRHYRAHETAGEDARDGLPLARFWQRALGFTIDFILMLVLFTAIVVGWMAFVTKKLHAQTNLHLEFDPRQHENFVFMFVYFVIATYIGNGQSPGKWCARTRVVSLTKARMGFWQSTERALGYGASLLEGGFGFVQYFLNRNRMCVHDRIAETIVVDSRQAATRLKQTTEVEENDAEALAG